MSCPCSFPFSCNCSFLFSCPYSWPSPISAPAPASAHTSPPLLLLPLLLPCSCYCSLSLQCSWPCLISFRTSLLPAYAPSHPSLFFYSSPYSCSFYYPAPNPSYYPKPPSLLLLYLPHSCPCSLHLLPSPLYTSSRHWTTQHPVEKTTYLPSPANLLSGHHGNN